MQVLWGTGTPSLTASLASLTASLRHSRTPSLPPSIPHFLALYQHYLFCNRSPLPPLTHSLTHPLTHHSSLTTHSPLLRKYDRLTVTNSTIVNETEIQTASTAVYSTIPLFHDRPEKKHLAFYCRISRKRNKIIKY